LAVIERKRLTKQREIFELASGPATEAGSLFALEPLSFALLAVRRDVRRLLGLEKRSDARRHFRNGRREAFGFGDR
jgi:hypothetical protein